MAPPLAPFIAVIPALIIRTEKGIVKDLREANATSAGRAIALSGSFMRRARAQRMTAAGALGFAGPDRYYLIESGWRDYRSTRRKRAAIIIGISLALLYVGYMLLSVGNRAG